MTIDELKNFKEKILNETKYKQRMRRENDSCFISNEYYRYGINQKTLFIRRAQMAIRKVNAQQNLKESD